MLIRKTLDEPRWLGVDHGTYEFLIAIDGARPCEVELHDVVMVRRFEKMLRRLADQDPSIEVLAESWGFVVEDLVWWLLEPARACACCDGEYVVTFLKIAEVTYTLSERDAALMARYVGLLSNFYEENRDAVDRALSTARSASDARPPGRLPPGEGAEGLDLPSPRAAGHVRLSPRLR
jgi:hypothetical protein